MRTSTCAFAALLACTSLSVMADQTPTPDAVPPPPDCNGEVHRQFDFWVGDWSVLVAGQVAGENRIERILNGCALLENWSGKGGMNGKSLNFYDRRRDMWHQTWIDDRGGALHLDGRFADGKMVLEGRADAKGKTLRHRITWTPLPAGELRQLWETSEDGTTWSVAFDGHYKRKS